MLTLHQVKLPISHTDFSYQRRSGEKNSKAPENFISGASVLEDPEAVLGCQEKARVAFCIHDRCFC